MSKKTLNKINLEGLGAEKLADLLLEVSAGSADIKRRLRFELSHHLGPEELGREVRKRLVSIRKSKTYAGWRKRKVLVKDLQIQADMICDKIAVDDPNLAFDLLWEFVALAPSVYARTDDSRGEVATVFTVARARFEDIAPLAQLDPKALATRVWDALQDSLYGEFEGIIGLTALAMGDDGLDHLKGLITSYGHAPVETSDDDHEALVFLRSLRGDDAQPDAKKARQVKAWLQEIAVVQGDVDAYVAQYSTQDLKHPEVAAETANLWMDAGRDMDALDLLETADQDGPPPAQQSWDAAYIRCLTALDRLDDAQTHRWLRFEQTLSADHLRGYLKPLADFDDIEVEERAKSYALAFQRFHSALVFFLNWPDLTLAARLVETRGDEADGDMYWVLAPAAEALSARHPLAATVLFRAMIDYALEGGQHSRYAHAADHLMDCAALDGEIADYGAALTHLEYVAQLEHRHARKSAFWSKLGASSS